MNIKHIQILSDAEADLEAGRAFYEAQQKGIGAYFWDSLISDIEECTALVIAVLPEKRNPDWVYQRLKGFTGP